MLLLILSGTVFLSLSGLLCAVDAALLSVTAPEIQELILQRKRGARRLRTVTLELTRSMAVVVILTNTINVLGPIIVSQQAVNALGAGVLGIVSVALTFGTIVISEVVPKSIGQRYATVISRFAAIPIHALRRVLFPLVAGLEWLARLFTSGTRPIGTEEQIRSLVIIGRKAGLIEADEGSLIHRAFILNDRTAADLMTPLSGVVSLSASATIGEAVGTVRESVFSRFPVFGGSMHDVTGIVMARELLEAVVDGRSAEFVRAVVRPAFIVSSDAPADDLLVKFRNLHIHLAVVEEAGHTVGIVTLEDVLEELVGEIEDEKDFEKGISE